MAPRPGTVLVYDTTERQAPWLSRWWSLGSLISQSETVVPAASWADVYLALGEHEGDVDLLQVWGHGNDGTPLIGGRTVSLGDLSSALQRTPATEVWWRSCEVHRGIAGQRFAERAVDILGCRSVGHCKVISAPNPLRQSAICGLYPGQTPWWPVDGAGLPGVWLTEMRVPERAYREVS